MTNSSKLPLGHGSLAYSGLLVGAYSGVLFSLLSFTFYGSDSAAFMFGARHAAHSYAYTIAIYSLLAGAAGAVFGVLLWALSRVLPLIRGKAVWILLVFPFAALIPFVFVNAEWQISQPRNVPLLDEYRVAYLQKSALLSAAAGLALSVILVLALHRAHLLGRLRRFHAVFLAVVLVVAVGTLAQMHLVHGRISSVRVENLSQQDAGCTGVLLIGLDGATWTVLETMLGQGKLPHLKRFKDESAFGPLQVYGKAYSPAVWTTVATGVRRFRHGIMTHTVLGPEGVVRTGSQHRKVPAIWNIANAAGLKAGLINYMATYPPEHVAGFNFTNITPLGVTPYEVSIWPPELIPEVSRLVESAPPGEGVDDQVAELNREVDVLTRLFVRFWDPSYSFFTVYAHSTDAVEHRYWNYMFPEGFRGTMFQPTPEELREKGEAICNHWENVDNLFEQVNSMVGPNTAVIVVSDHGMESATAPQVHLSVNRLLAKMGLLVFGEDGGIDYSRTLAYWPAGSDVNLRATGVTINRRANPAFLEGGRSFEEIRDHVINKLRQVRLVGTGEPFFPAVHRSEEETDAAYREILHETDVILHLSAYTRGTDLKESLDIGGESIPLSEVLRMARDVSGAHHPRGVIMARGIPFRKGPVFARPTVETPVSDVLQRVFGRERRLDGLMAVAKSLGIIDRATTLDIAQTTLYLLGLPSADYMEGRVLVEGLTRSYASAHPEVLIADYGPLGGERPAEDAVPASAEELERLRSLGYVD